MGYKLIFLLVIFSLPFPLAAAEMVRKDIAVIARTISLIENGPIGKVKLAIIKDDTLQQEAETFAALVNSGKAVGKITLDAVAISASGIAASNAKVLLIPEGTDQQSMEEAFRIAKEQKLITLTTSESCLNQQKCAIYFKSSPAVDIRLSQSAAKETGVRFGSAMRMMIKEVP